MVYIHGAESYFSLVAKNEPHVRAMVKAIENAEIDFMRAVREIAKTGDGKDMTLEL